MTTAQVGSAPIAIQFDDRQDGWAYRSLPILGLRGGVSCEMAENGEAANAQTASSCSFGGEPLWSRRRCWSGSTVPAVRKRHSAASTQATRVLAKAGLDDVDILTERLVSAIFTDNPEWTDYGSVPVI